jgi:hypothetical protein
VEGLRAFKITADEMEALLSRKGRNQDEMQAEAESFHKYKVAMETLQKDYSTTFDKSSTRVHLTVFQSLMTQVIRLPITLPQIENGLLRESATLNRMVTIFERANGPDGVLPVPQFRTLSETYNNSRLHVGKVAQLLEVYQRELNTVTTIMNDAIALLTSNEDIIIHVRAAFEFEGRIQEIKLKFIRNDDVYLHAIIILRILQVCLEAQYLVHHQVPEEEEKNIKNRILEKHRSLMLQRDKFIEVSGAKAAQIWSRLENEVRKVLNMVARE